jgi:hypothetical protein
MGRGVPKRDKSPEYSEYESHEKVQRPGSMLACPGAVAADAGVIAAHGGAIGTHPWAIAARLILIAGWRTAAF